MTNRSSCGRFFLLLHSQLQEARRVMSAILLATFVALCRSAVLVVNSMGTNTNFTTIQAAINSASCGFVFVVVQLCVCVKRRTALRCGARVRSHKRSPFSLTRLIKPCCWLACSRSRRADVGDTVRVDNGVYNESAVVKRRAHAPTTTLLLRLTVVCARSFPCVACRSRAAVSWPRARAQTSPR